jgi:YVTN family beta-propeller protein
MFTPDAKLLLATNFDGAINFVDPASDKVVNTLMTPGMNPSGIAITPDGTTAYVTNYSNSQPGLMIINIANRSMTGLITTPGYPKSVFLTPDGTQAWVTSIDSSTIYIVDLFTQTVTTTLNTPGYAHTGLAFNPTGTRAYVAVQPSNLYVIDTATYDAVANITIGPVPNDVIVNRTGTAVYVSGYDAMGTLSAVDTATNKLLSTIQAGSPASHMILLPGAP